MRSAKVKKSRIIRAEKTIGIIGGMGPYATLEFFRYLLDATPVRKDWEHVHIIIDNNPKTPSRTRAFLYEEASPVPMMRESALRLMNAGADLLTLPCNSAHYFMPEVLKDIDAPFVNMVDETAKVIQQEGYGKGGLLGGEVTTKAGLYEQRLDKTGIEVLHVGESRQNLVNGLIEDAKLDRVGKATFSTMEALVKFLRTEGAEAIILACTELPMITKAMDNDCDIVDSLDCLTRAVLARV